MGRLHCVESDCATVWVKTPGQEEITEERILAGNVRVSSNLTGLHHWRLNGSNVTYANAQPFDDLVDWNIEHQGDYCQVNIPNFRYDSVDVDADFEIIDGEDWNGNKNLVVPLRNYKRLIMGRNLTTGFTTRAALIIYYADETDNSNPCNLKLLDPRDYGGTSHVWYGYRTQRTLNIHSPEKAIFQAADRFGNEYVLEATSRFGIDTYAFQGQDPFDLEWTRIDETETILVQPKIKDSWQAFKVEKQPYLEKVEVVDFAYDFSPFGGVLNPNQTIEIPRNCLNIYRTETNPSSGILGLGNVGAEFIAQFCTDDPAGTEPPEYYVVCGCDKCPPGTCEIDCGDHICCYNSEGVAEVIINK